MGKGRKKKFLIACILAISVRFSRANGVPLPSAYGFMNIKPPECRNYGIQSRASTGISTNYKRITY